jgi:hypothetical protein
VCSCTMTFCIVVSLSHLPSASCAFFYSMATKKKNSQNVRFTAVSLKNVLKSRKVKKDTPSSSEERKLK